LHNTKIVPLVNLFTTARARQKLDQAWFMPARAAGDDRTIESAGLRADNGQRFLPLSLPHIAP